MEEHIHLEDKNSHCCPTMTRILERGLSALFYEPDIRRYSIKELLENTTGVMANTIRNCPWCGNRLPLSLGETWEETLKKEFGIHNPLDTNQRKLIPKEFLTDEWWKKRNL